MFSRVFLSFLGNDSEECESSEGKTAQVSLTSFPTSQVFHPSRAIFSKFTFSSFSLVAFSRLNFEIRSRTSRELSE